MDFSDEALCQRVAERDEEAFGLLVGRYQGRVYRLAWSILRNAEEARDLSQDAFIRLYEAAGRFDGRSRFSTWFYRILVNLCLDHRRRHRFWYRILTPTTSRDDSPGSLLDQQPAPLQDPVDDLAEKERRQRLWAAVERLPPRQRAALILQVQEGLRIVEIAAVLKCSEATVRVHLHRALIALRKMIGKGSHATETSRD